MGYHSLVHEFTLIQAECGGGCLIVRLATAVWHPLRPAVTQPEHSTTIQMNGKMRVSTAALDLV